jgi:hypothetical protein
VVGTADLLIVLDTDRVILTDTVLDTVTEPDRVLNPDAGTVYRGDEVTVRERVRVSDTVGLIDLVNGCVVANGLRVPDPHRVIVRETVRLTDRVFGKLVAIALLLRVILTLTLRVGEMLTETVIMDRVMLVVGETDLVAICVLGMGVRVVVTTIVLDTLPVKEAVKLFTDLVAYGVLAIGDRLIVMAERVNVADGHVDILIVCVRVIKEGLPLADTVCILGDPLTDFVKPVLDPHGLPVLDGTIDADPRAEEDTVACELDADTVAEYVIGEAEGLIVAAEVKEDKGLVDPLAVTIEAEGVIVDMAEELVVPTEVPLTADLEPLVDPVVDFDSLTVLDRPGLIDKEPVLEDKTLAELV